MAKKEDLIQYLFERQNMPDLKKRFFSYENPKKYYDTTVTYIVRNGLLRILFYSELDFLKHKKNLRNKPFCRFEITKLDYKDKPIRKKTKKIKCRISHIVSSAEMQFLVLEIIKELKAKTNRKKKTL